MELERNLTTAAFGLIKVCPAWRVWGTRRGGVCPMRKGTQTLSDFERPGHGGAKRNLGCAPAATVCGEPIGIERRIPVRPTVRSS